jgi:hypothetical protein
MHGDTLAMVEQLDPVGGETGLDLLADQGVGDRVIEVLNLDMVVLIDAGFLPLGVFVGCRW